MDTKTAARLQPELILHYIDDAIEQKDHAKQLFLENLLKNKINVPSNHMVSKAGKFFNIRNIGYETIFQQNKVSLKDALSQLEARKRNKQLTDQSQQSGVADKPNGDDNQDDEEGYDQERILNTKCLQYKKEKGEKLMLKEIHLKSSERSTPCFRSPGRQSNKNTDASKQESCALKYTPTYEQVFPQAPAHKFLPLPSTQRLEQVMSQPDCIVRGNLCDYQFRMLAAELKQKAEIIQERIQQLEGIENQLKECTEATTQHRIEQKKIDKLLENKRIVAESMLEAQREFILLRNIYEQKVSQNIDEFEVHLFNNQINYPTARSQSPPAFKTMQARGPLFPELAVEDLTERQFNNYNNENSDGLIKAVRFDRLKPRDVLFKPKEGPHCYDHSQDIQITNACCLVDMKKQAKNDKPSVIMREDDINNSRLQLVQLDWKRVARAQDCAGQMKLGRTFTDMARSTSRDKPHPNQSRFIPVNQNFYPVNQRAFSSKEREKMHQPGIEPGSKRWQRSILPLNH